MHHIIMESDSDDDGFPLPDDDDHYIQHHDIHPSTPERQGGYSDHNEQDERALDDIVSGTTYHSLCRDTVLLRVLDLAVQLKQRDGMASRLVDSITSDWIHSDDVVAFSAGGLRPVYYSIRSITEYSHHQFMELRRRSSNLGGAPLPFTFSYPHNPREHLDTSALGFRHVVHDESEWNAQFQSSYLDLLAQHSVPIDDDVIFAALRSQIEALAIDFLPGMFISIWFTVRVFV